MLWQCYMAINCKKGAHLEIKGKEVTCPGHENCNATIPSETTIRNEKK